MLYLFIRKIELPHYYASLKLLLFIHDILAQRNRKLEFTITSNKGTWGLMHINGIMIAKQFISQGNFKRLRGSVGRAHVQVGCIFLNFEY